MLIAKAINAREALLPPKITPRSDISVLMTPIIAASDVRSRRKTTTPRRTAQGSIALGALFFLRIGIVEINVASIGILCNWHDQVLGIKYYVLGMKLRFMCSFILNT